MRHRRLDFAEDFEVVLGNARAQAAVMVIAPGGSEGGPDNRHSGADQWLYVVEGEGEAIVEGENVPLGPGALLLVERGEAHEIRALGRDPLRTLNLYVPPAYDARSEEPLPAGEP